jgi:arginine decarboxylase
MVGHACITAGDIVLVDRNCHKSICHTLTMTGAIPIYFIPQRNAYGIIGGISSDQFDPILLKERILKCPLLSDEQKKDESLRRPKLVIITNSTYDGLVYDVGEIIRRVGSEVDAIHFDEE